MKDKLNIVSLIFARLLGTINNRDDARLQRWIESSTANKELYDSLVDLDSIEEKFKAYNDLFLITEKDLMLKKIKEINSLKKNYFKIFLRYAAVLLLPLILFYSDRCEYLLVTNKFDYVAGRSSAVLEISGGRKLSLDTLKCISTNGLMIKNDSCILDIRALSSINTEPQNYNKIIVPKGGEYTLCLSDGSKVWINSDSELRFPARFSEDERLVYISGEAYFEVSHSEIPFKVVYNDMEIQVLGTAFNVMAYEDEPMVETTLVRGSVRVNIGDTNAKSVLLEAGEQLGYSEKSKKIKKKTVNVNNYIAWKDKTFVFADETIDVIARKLSRWYNVEIDIISPEISKEVFFGVLPKYENISSILDMLKKVKDIDYEITKEKVIIKSK